MTWHEEETIISPISLSLDHPLRVVKNKTDKNQGKYRATKDKNYERVLKGKKGKYRAKRQ